MKKIIQFLILAFFIMPFLVNAQITPSAAVPQMMRGINIGNTMEAPSEGAWNGPIQSYYFDDLKAAGFNTIRIPMNWWNHTSHTAPYTIDAAWLNRVEQVVDWGLARGFYIVMNTHHETQFFDNWNTYLPMYISVWTQVAQRMKGKSDHLLFELLNEPHGSPTVDNLNQFNTQAVKAIRNSNPTRIIVYSGNQWANSYNLINTSLVNPNPGDKNLMGYYHSYDPISFGLDGTGTFGTDSDKQAIWNKMQSVADWATKTGINAYLGEFGATSSGDLNSRFRYYATNVDYAISHNIPFMAWDDNGGFQIYIRGSRKFNEIKDILVHYYPQSTTNFTATQSGGVVLKWTNRAPNATSISVQRKLTSSDSYVTIATISATSTSYTDNSAPAGTYYYRVISNVDATTQYYGYPQIITTTGGPTFAVSLSADRTTICSGKAATLTASTVITSGTVSKVDFYEGPTLLATDNTAPYTYTVSNPTTGTHTYTAKATSSTGAVVTSAGVNVDMGTGAVITPYILVNNGTWANQNTATVCSGASIVLGPQPVVTTGWTWKGPNGFTATTREITISPVTSQNAGIYTATYDDGSGCPGTMNFTITVNTTPAPIVTSPITYNLNAAAAPLTATGTNLKWFTAATGGLALATTPTPNTTVAGTTSYFVSQTQSGCESTRSEIDVIVINSNQPPIVSITSPANNAAFTAPASVAITANASDADGTISSVQFFNGTTLLGTSTTAPYSFSWNNVTAGTYSITAKATDNNGAVTVSTEVIINVNPAVVQGPVVSITSPANNVSYTAPASVTITASTTDATGTITSMQFLNGNTVIGIDSIAPYSIVWANVAAGTYSITASATDNNGATGISSAVTVKVNAPLPPTISITSPANNASFTAPANITITATATSASGSINNVKFLNGTTIIGVDSIAPYNFVWSNVTAGIYSITASATDNYGASATSSAVILKVNAPAPPTVSITSPANNAGFTTPVTITIAASASDADGSITSVQFYNGSTLLGTDASSPYSFSWTNVAAGSYSITAKATDNSGLISTSTAISITVTAPATGDFTGPACGAPNSTITFELNPSHRTSATNYSWWFQGYTQSITPVAGSTYIVNIATGPYFTGGQVCIGINYSVAPYYASYCKTVSLCPSSLMAAAAFIEPASIAPNPSSGPITITVSEDVTSFKLVNDKGQMVYSGGSISAGGSGTCDKHLSSGLYVLVIQYASGRIESLKVLRTL
jgi:aryl-phospho-beta-D-glucosidase BglC (GH1 family)